MIRDILQIGADVLTEKTTEIKDPKSGETLQLIEDLLDTCIDKTQGTAGLSAPQIGISKRVCVCRRTDLEEELGENNVSEDKLWEVMINPEITYNSDNESIFWEGCLSIGVGDDQLFGPVNRPYEVKVEYMSPDGEKKSLTANGFFSHVVQHELDHLDGILFVNYISNPKNIWRNKELDKYLTTHGDFPPIE